MCSDPLIQFGLRDALLMWFDGFHEGTSFKGCVSPQFLTDLVRCERNFFVVDLKRYGHPLSRRRRDKSRKSHGVEK